MDNYYVERLNSQRLFRVYETGIPRVSQYLEAEIDYVRKGLRRTHRVLELGAGYGRIVRELAPHCAHVTGMDISEQNVELGRHYLRDHPNASMVVMDVHQMSFGEPFDVILCLQNGLSAMRADLPVVRRTLELLTLGGTAYFSSYSARFWDWRLKWFEEQAEKGLLGEIDYDQTKDGVIVCKDGFRATTHTPADFAKIGDRLGYPYLVQEVDESSLFLVISRREA